MSFFNCRHTDGGLDLPAFACHTNWYSSRRVKFEESFRCVFQNFLRESTSWPARSVLLLPLHPLSQRPVVDLYLVFGRVAVGGVGRVQAEALAGIGSDVGGVCRAKKKWLVWFGFITGSCENITQVRIKLSPWLTAWLQAWDFGTGRWNCHHPYVALVTLTLLLASFLPQRSWTTSKSLNVSSHHLANFRQIHL